MAASATKNESQSEHAEACWLGSCADLGVAPQEEDYVHVSRSQPRNRETGAICFDVTYSDGSWARVPIQVFMDAADATFSHEAVAEAVNDWVAVAKCYPSTHRKCLCCNRRAAAALVLCTKCYPTWGETVYI